MLRLKRALGLAAIAAAVGWAAWSYHRGGLVFVLSTAPSDRTIAAVRAYVLGWGAWAPLFYVAAVVVEVMVAPIPGTLLYAPAGAIWGGLVGGALSLAGNVIGAAIACAIAGAFGESWRRRHAANPRFAHYQALLERRGGWIVFVLRVNPLTSSDLVSYAAGVAGVPATHVAAGTLFGMAPLCFAQAYLAETLFDWLPGGVLAVAIGSVAIAAAVWFLVRRR